MKEVLVMTPFMAKARFITGNIGPLILASGLIINLMEQEHSTTSFQLGSAILSIIKISTWSMRDG